MRRRFRRWLKLITIYMEWTWKQTKGDLEHCRAALASLSCSMEVVVCLVGDTNSPVGRSNIVSYDSLLGGVGSDLEREGLATKCREDLVGSTPIVAHGHPSCSASFHPNAINISPSSNVHHIHKQPVCIPLEWELKPSFLDARNPANMVIKG